MDAQLAVCAARSRAGILRKKAVLLRKGCSFEITSSASEDLGCRRGEFSRKHYGSVELLISSDADGAIQRAGRFRVENGSSDEPLLIGVPLGSRDWMPYSSSSASAVTAVPSPLTGSPITAMKTMPSSSFLLPLWLQKYPQKYLPLGHL